MAGKYASGIFHGPVNMYIRFLTSLLGKLRRNEDSFERHLEYKDFESLVSSPLGDAMKMEVG